MAVSRETTSEWTLWIVAVSCALHVAEEYLTGGQEWARETLGIAALLYLPFSSWARVGAARDGVPRKTIATAFVAGTVVMARAVLSAIWLRDAGGSGG